MSEHPGTFRIVIDDDSLRAMVKLIVAETLAQVRSEPGPEHWLQIHQVSEILGLGETKIRELIGQGRLRSVLVDTSRRIPESAVKEFQSKTEGSK